MKSASVSHLLFILIYDLAEDWFQRPAWPASGRCIEDNDDPVALVVQLAQCQLALVAVLVDVKICFQLRLVLLIWL